MDVSPRLNTGPYFLILTPNNVVLYVCMVILVMFVESIRFYYVSDNLSDNGLRVVLVLVDECNTGY